MHYCPVCSGKQIKKGINDLFTTNPELKSEWDFQENINIDPYKIIAGSNKKVAWKCTKGHKCQAIVNNRANHHTKCPVCTHTIPEKGVNDIFTVAPNLKQLRNYEKNITYNPYKLSSKSKISVWWKCKNGHDFKMAFKKMVQNNCCQKC